MASIKKLSDLKTGQAGTVLKISGEKQIRRRIMDMGVLKGSEVEVLRIAPLGDPIEFSVRGYNLSLRKSEAGLIDVEVG